MSKIEIAVQFAVDVANDNYHGYSQERRDGGRDMDCSKIVISALKSAGYDTGSASYTGDMLNPLLAAGFKDVASSVNLHTGEGLLRGDILLRPKTSARSGHAAFYIGDGKIVQAQSDYDGVLGDSSDREIRIQSYYDSPFLYVLRDPDAIACPYPEPDTLFKNGITFRGDDARWFQWHLNRAGYALTLDGIAGSKTWLAINKAQEKGAIGAGNAGSLTRAIIRKM